MIFSLLGILTSYSLKMRNAKYIAVYCFVSSVYLLSFSEIPREYLNPDVFSGVIHFPLRLLQDMLLCIVFNSILNKQKDYRSFYKGLIFAYAVVLGLFLVSAIFGKYQFSFVKHIILTAAPLVAMPMFYGLMLVWRLPKGSERKLLVPMFVILFLFQVNDLLVFWQLIDSYFTVKFYIPFVVIILVFMEVRRYSINYAEKSLLAGKVQITKQIAHDIRSPLSTLNIVAYQLKQSGEISEILTSAITSIDQIASQLMEQSKINHSSLTDIKKVVKNVIEQKLVEYPNLKINYHDDLKTQVMCSGNPIDLLRVLSNGSTTK